MKVKNIVLTLSALVLGISGTFVAVRAQGPLYDKVIVDLPYAVTVRGTTLQPGQYVIQQAPSGDNSRVVQIFSNDGMKLETSVITIPALDNNTPDKTEVVLHHFGNDYYFDKVWVQGKNYGYEFPLPKDVQSRESERSAPVTVGATYQAAPAESTATTQSAQPAAATSESAASQQPADTDEPATAQASPAVPERQPAAPAPSETTTQQNVPRQNDEQTAPAQPPANAASGDDASAAPETRARNREMPKTAANWLTMLLTGGLLSGAGIALRRVTA